MLTRCERLANAGSLDDVTQVLERLQQRGFVANVGRASGQREDRYAHLFCGAVEVHARRDEEEVASSPGGASLAQRVADLEALTASLMARIDALEQGAARGTTESASLAP